VKIAAGLLRFDVADGDNSERLGFYESKIGEQTFSESAVNLPTFRTPSQDGEQDHGCASQGLTRRRNAGVIAPSSLTADFADSFPRNQQKAARTGLFLCHPRFSPDDERPIRDVSTWLDMAIR
jgi:hypothetical protein